MLFKEAIQFKPFPQFQSEEAGAERARSFKTYFVHQHARYLRIVNRHRHSRWKQLQLMSVSLIVEDLNRPHPARVSRTVQLAQIADRPLTRSSSDEIVL